MIQKILSNYQNETMKNHIESNFEETKTWTKLKNTKGNFWMVIDTACPVQIRNFPMQNPPKKRFPDAIGFGFAKCGTGRYGLNQK